MSEIDGNAVFNDLMKLSQNDPRAFLTANWGVIKSLLLVFNRKALVKQLNDSGVNISYQQFRRLELKNKDIQAGSAGALALPVIAPSPAAPVAKPPMPRTLMEVPVPVPEPEAGVSGTETADRMREISRQTREAGYGQRLVRHPRK